MKKIALVSAVVVSMIVGWICAQGIIHAAGKPKRFLPGAGPVVFAEQHGIKWHMTVELDRRNHAGPGRLGAVAIFRVKDPDTIGDPMVYVLVADVRDEAGNLWVDGDMLGTVSDRVGVGNWHREFRMLYDLPPGSYHLEVFLCALNENLPRQLAQRQAGGGSEAVFIVK